MKRDMKRWMSEQIANPRKKPLPVLSFPAVQLMGISVKELIADSDTYAKGMKMVADRVDTAAAVSLMDLSVEAECFGSNIVVSDDEVPTVRGRVISSQVEADALTIPPTGCGRTGVNIDAIKKVVELITDRPVFAGCIGPFSLAGRLMDVNEIMIYCYTEPQMVHTVLRKVTDFITDYIMALKAAGANGVVIAEPLAGILSPDLAQSVSSYYVRKIVHAVTDDHFVVIYHNCGNEAGKMIPSLISTDAARFHFGNSVDMEKILAQMPEDVVVFGNIDPSSVFRQGTPETVREKTLNLLRKCGKYPNFVISSGCDIPPLTPWENIDAFFAAVAEYDREGMSRGEADAEKKYRRDMKQWVADMIASPVKKPFPVLSFPVIQMMGISVKELIMDSRLQAIGMKMIAEHCDTAAIVSQMDLSIEAEAFGSHIIFSDDEVPTVTGRIISSQVEADALEIPEIGSARMGINIAAVARAVKLVTDRPVFAGCIGPFSLAGRLMDVNEIMVYCYTEPQMVHTVLEKVTEFLIDYALAYKEAGAHGIVIAEPLAGILSPDLATKVSARYVRRIVNAVTDDDFIVIYHNCGNEAVKMLPTILMSNAAGYHFGNGVDMKEVVRKMPEDVLVLGNVDPAGVFLQGTPETVRAATLKVLEDCADHPNFVISSGCDIPPLTPWQNIDTFFAAAKEFYAQKGKEE